MKVAPEGVQLSDKTYTAPDWEYWSYIPYPYLWQAVALSCDIKPGRGQIYLDDPQLNLPAEFVNRLDIAIANAATLRLDESTQIARQLDVIGIIQMRKYEQTYTRNVELLAFIEWVRKYTKWQIPPELMSLLPPSKVDDNKIEETSASDSEGVQPATRNAPTTSSELGKRSRVSANESRLANINATNKLGENEERMTFNSIEAAKNRIIEVDEQLSKSTEFRKAIARRERLSNLIGCDPKGNKIYQHGNLSSIISKHKKSEKGLP